MKTLLLLFLFPLTLFASDISRDTTVTERITLWQWLIPAAVPLLIALLKYYWTKIPTKLIPVFAVGIGTLLDVGLNAFDMGDGWGAIGVAFGALGIGIREIIDQNVPVKKKKK